MLLNQLSCSHSSNMVGHTAVEVQQRVTQSLHLPFMLGRIFFPGLVPPNDKIDSESVAGIQPSDYGMVIGYQVDEFTCT